MNKKVENLSKIILDGSRRTNKKAVLCFDAVIDNIVKVVKKRDNAADLDFFNDISEFGDYILSKKNLSCCIEMKCLRQKLGGNMSILADSMSNQCIGVTCIGSMGQAEIHPIFAELKKKCDIYGILEPAQCFALEFQDGKVMLALNNLEQINWDVLVEKIGLEKLVELYDQCDLACFLNWSEVIHSNEIWEGFLKEILPQLQSGKNRMAFFDLSDISARSRGELITALELMRQFSAKFKVVLSLNENESRNVYRTIKGSSQINDIKKIGEEIFGSLGMDVLVIHMAASSLAWDSGGFSSYNTFYTDKPKILTGGGDNFNAGLCTGMLLGLDLKDSLVYANVVAGFYIRFGRSPSIEETELFLREMAGNEVESTFFFT